VASKPRKSLSLVGVIFWNRLTPAQRQHNRTGDRPAIAGAKGGFKGPVGRRIIVEGQIGLRDPGIAVQPSVFLDSRSVEVYCLLLARRLV